MAVWNRLKSELDRAGRAAQAAIDEGKLRLDMHRARSAADRQAQLLGYAVYRARVEGRELSAEEYARLASDLAAAEAEAKRFETLLEEAEEKRSGPGEPPGTKSTDAPPP
jgi:hypothetical protein